MSLAVGKKLDQLVADGFLSRADVQKAAEEMLDGKGVTRRERAVFNKRIDSFIDDPSVFLRKSTRKGIRNLQARLDEEGLGGKICAPGLDKAEIRSLLSLRVLAGNAGSGGEYSGGTYRPSPNPPPGSYSGGEA